MLDIRHLFHCCNQSYNGHDPIKGRADLTFFHQCYVRFTIPHCYCVELYLSQVDGKVDLIVFDTTRKWRALPPSLCTIHCILCGMRLVRLAGVTIVTHLKCKSGNYKRLNLHTIELSSHKYFFLKKPVKVHEMYA